MDSLPLSEESWFHYFLCSVEDCDHLLLKLEVPARLFVNRRVFGVLWEIVKVAVVQRSVHLMEENRTLMLSSVCCRLVETLKDTHRGRERRVYGSLAETVPVEALKPPEGQGHVAMTTGSSPIEERNLMKSIFTVSLVFLYVFHSILLISQPL